MPAEQPRDSPFRPAPSKRPGERSRLAVEAVRLSIAVAVVIAAAAVADAVSGDDERAALEHESTRLVALPYWAFEKAARRRSAPFDWSTDGCSRTPRVLATRFAGPCRQHDFAYRNLGRGLRLSATEDARDWADARFHDELRRRCGELFTGRRLARCRLGARGMWAAVRRYGPRWNPARTAQRSLRDTAGCTIVAQGAGAPDSRVIRIRGQPATLTTAPPTRLQKRTVEVRNYTSVDAAAHRST